jgi:2-hydroxy-3-oxopropionate reductase
MKATIALIGTGIMGAPMCLHLVAAGYPTKAWNRSREKLAPLTQKGVQAYDTAAEAVAGADFVIIMLSSGPVVDKILFGKAGSKQNLVDAIRPGATVIVMSSIPVQTSRLQAQRLLKRGIRYLDAPVSGGEKGAIDGKLTIMAGGDKAVMDDAQAVLESMGRVTHVGPVGCGQLAKLANQTIVGITIAAVAEALLLAQAGGADLELVHSALTGGHADSTVWREHGKRMIQQNFKPGARAKTQLKDLHTSLELARELQLDLPLLELCEGLYRQMCEGGHKNLDHSALFLAIQDRVSRFKGDRFKGDGAD